MQTLFFIVVTTHIHTDFWVHVHLYMVSFIYGRELGRYICDIYRKELELKDEHQGEHATFLYLDIIIKEGTLIYKLFDKRDFFLFQIIRMPHIESNIPQMFFFLLSN